VAAQSHSAFDDLMREKLSAYAPPSSSNEVAAPVVPYAAWMRPGAPALSLSSDVDYFGVAPLAAVIKEGVPAHAASLRRRLAHASPLLGTPLHDLVPARMSLSVSHLGAHAGSHAACGGPNIMHPGYAELLSLDDYATLPNGLFRIGGGSADSHAPLIVDGAPGASLFVTLLRRSFRTKLKPAPKGQIGPPVALRVLVRAHPMSDEEAVDWVR
jgi:hypothetical protein